MRTEGSPSGSLPWGSFGALAALALLAACADTPYHCGTDQPDPDEDVVGCIVDEGDEPVAGVMVYVTRTEPLVAKAGYDRSVAVPRPDDSVVSDKWGRYVFNALEPGYYIIEATDTLGRRLSPDTVQVKKEPLRYVYDNVLYRTGIISGWVEDVNGVGLNYIKCDVPGKPFTVHTDTGRFELALPPGLYDLRCGDPSYVLTRVDGIKVESGMTREVTFILLKTEDVEQKPPQPDTAFHSYDDITAIVNLWWPRVKYHKAIIYTIQRIDPTAVDPKTGGQLSVQWSTPDTFATDVIFWAKGETNGPQGKRKPVTYNIRTSLATEYVFSKEPFKLTITVSPPLFLGPSVRVIPRDTGLVYAVGDTVWLVGEFHNAFRVNRKTAWTLEGTGTELKPVRETPDRDGTDTLAYPCTAPSAPSDQIRIRFSVTDESGAVGSDTYRFQIKAP